MLPDGRDSDRLSSRCRSTRPTCVTALAFTHSPAAHSFMSRVRSLCRRGFAPNGTGTLGRACLGRFGTRLRWRLSSPSPSTRLPSAPPSKPVWTTGTRQAATLGGTKPPSFSCRAPETWAHFSSRPVSHFVRLSSPTNTENAWLALPPNAWGCPAGAKGKYGCPSGANCLWLPRWGATSQKLMAAPAERHRAPDFATR